MTQLKCGWVPAIAENKCMQRTEPCPEQHHVHALSRIVGLPNDLHTKLGGEFT